MTVVSVLLEEDVTATELSVTAGNVRAGMTPVPGFGVSQAIHFVASGLFWTRQVSQSHALGDGLNLSSKLNVPAAGTAALEVTHWLEVIISFVLSTAETSAASDVTHLPSTVLFCRDSSYVSDCPNEDACSEVSLPAEKLLIAGLV